MVFMRDVMEVILCNLDEKLGGPGKIVELDESVLVHRKYHKGRRLAMSVTIMIKRCLAMQS